MENDDDLYLEWEDDSAFINLPDISLQSLEDTHGTDFNDKFSFKERHNHRETDADLDYALAVSLQMQLDNEIKENKNNNSSERSGASKPLSIIDKQWELIDPVPDIHALFIEFDEKFFYGKLKSVEVRWSPRMTLCAGICSYQGRGGLCSIALSVPLLKLRPRSDLVETLLHEMIHAYLFVTHNNKDRDGHGPEFLSHMHRINKDAGTRISVYHSFHDEVKLYKQHWWKCDGPCNKRPPFYGFVKRSMNRAPGPNDNWWAAHQSSCGGKYVKVKEPENYGEKKKRKLQSDSKTQQPLSDIRKFAKVGNSSLSSKERQSKAMAVVSPVLSPQKPITSKGDNLGLKSIETPKKKNFVPFFGAGHKLGGSSETIQTYFSIPSSSTNAKKIHKEDSVWKLPASSPGKDSLLQSRLVKNLKTPSPSKIIPKGHSINNANASPKPCLQNRKITDSFKASSKKTNILKNDSSESVVPLRNQSDSCHPLQNHIATHSDVPDNVTSMYCPVCLNLVQEEINSHLDRCLKNQN